VLNPQYGAWTKPKESEFADLVFLFRDPVTGFVAEQVVHLAATPMDQIVHIVSHYFVTSHQKQVLLQFLSRQPGVPRLVWAQHEPGQISYEIEPTMFRPTAQTYIPQHALTQPPPIEKRAPGRPAGTGPRQLEAKLEAEKPRPWVQFYNIASPPASAPEPVTQPAHTQPTPVAQAWQPTAQDEPQLSDIEELRLICHDPSALEVPAGAKRDDLYVNKIGRQNPDHMSDAAIRSMALHVFGRT
jgi:hypothetical protein